MVVLISVAASMAGIIALLYVALIGQKTLPEWWRDRRHPMLRIAPAVGILQNLPHRPYRAFINRREELQNALLALKEPRDPLVSIVGLGGIGKTALALEVCHTFLADPGRRKIYDFDSIIWCSAKQFELLPDGTLERSLRIRTLDDIYRTIAVLLDRKDVLQESPSGRDLVIRTLLSRRRILLLIDNIETADDQSILAFLRSIPSPTKVLITTRPSLGFGMEIRLGGLSHDDTLSLVRQEVANKGGEYSEATASEIYDTTQGVALATIWSAAQAAYGLTEGTVKSRIEQYGGDIVGFSFSNAVEGIRGTSAYSLLLALAMFATDADIARVGRVAGISAPQEIEQALLALDRLSLITRSGRRINMLPLTRQFVGTELENNPTFRREARSRLYATMSEYVKVYLGTEYWEPITKWLEAERVEAEVENLLLCLDWARRDEAHETVLALGGPLVHHLWRFGRVEERRIVSERAAEAAEALGESVWRIWLLVDGIGYIYLARRDVPQAEAVITQGRDLALQVGFDDGLSLADAYLAELAALRGDLDGVDGMLAAAEQRTGLAAVKARVRATQGNVAVVRGDWSLAATRYREAIDLRTLSDGYEPPTQLAYYGLTLARSGDVSAAEGVLQEASDHRRQTTEGRSYIHYGRALIRAQEGDSRKAREECDTASSLAGLMGESRLVEEIERFKDSLPPGPPHRGRRP